MSAHPQVVFLIPSETLGRVEDVYPEQLTSAHNDWIEHNRQILKKRKDATPPELRATSAAECPAMAELDSIGLLLKWPGTAILRQVTPKGWEIKPSSNFNFYNYSPLTSFAEAGEAEAITVDTGFTVVAPPGWSVLFKNLPNSIAGGPKGMTFAEGIVRADQATYPLKVHAFLGKGGAKEIKLKRGEPMAVLMAFRREPVAFAVMEESKFREEAARLAGVDRTTFENAPGGYKRLYVDDDNPSTLYPSLLADFVAREKTRK